MSSFEELDKLSTEELHDRAFKHAKHHLNAKFFFDLLQFTPVAETESGDLEEGERDAFHWSGQVADTFRDDDGKLSDALRPVYVDYLVKHADG